MIKYFIFVCVLRNIYNRAKCRIGLHDYQKVWSDYYVCSKCGGLFEMRGNMDGIDMIRQDINKGIEIATAVLNGNIFVVAEEKIFNYPNTYDMGSCCSLGPRPHDTVVEFFYG